ncbi:single-stranded-DNA-specific exonuclease RecJ [Candidatus Daviesbacteria bacterium RIFCSPHIGHO2_01_FULL_38_8]|nr:MAG: single-stranded-DNA-specific exonuclease RecJ [Candidatus Daviesbacteria bacterium RIFCSPHIGHO2_01_FULL_38_8]
MHKVWSIIKRKEKDLQKHLLSIRDVKSKKDSDEFFDPKIENYLKEFEIQNLKKAVERIKSAIDKKEQIFIYGDYDVDGVSASAVMYLGLKKIGASVLPYIPHREKEGYGLSKTGIDEIKKKDAKLIITVDNGIVALEQVKYAKDLGIDVIITDHHTPLDTLPDADVIVHSTAICGAAVAWCLIRKLVDEKTAKELLQFVSLGTIADMMPLLGVNRSLIVEGLRQLNTTTNIGLKALILESGLELGKISSFEIGFVLGPRLNAIGRLEHALDALRLLCTKDLLKATKLSRLLCDMNSKRQNLTQIAFDEARLQVQESKKIFVLGSQMWNPGIIGLVAARITEEFARPSIAISIGEAMAKGSARSIKGINIIEALRSVSPLLSEVGGHSGAAGFSIESTKIEEFRIKLEEYFKSVNIDEAVSALEIEAEVEKDELTKKTAKMIAELEPFGIGNPKPLLMTKNLKVSDIRTLSNGKHIKFRANNIDVIGFGMGELANQLKDGQLVDLAYYLEINKFNGSENLQLRLKDLKIK